MNMVRSGEWPGQFTWEDDMSKHLLSVAAEIALTVSVYPAVADEAAARKWVADEFQPSTLSKAEQMAEMKWFIKAADPFVGMEINVLSETIPTHDYESQVLT